MRQTFCVVSAHLQQLQSHRQSLVLKIRDAGSAFLWQAWRRWVKVYHLISFSFMVSWVVTIFDHIKDNYLLLAEWEFLKFKNFHLGRPQNPSRRFPANGKSTETLFLHFFNKNIFVINHWETAPHNVAISLRKYWIIQIKVFTIELPVTERICQYLSCMFKRKQATFAKWLF